MKKVVAMILCLVLVCFCVNICSAEASERLYFENLDGYEYDESTMGWKYQTEWSQSMGNYNTVVTVGIIAFGKAEGHIPAILCCHVSTDFDMGVSDEALRKQLLQVQIMYLLAGENVFSLYLDHNSIYVDGELSDAFLFTTHTEDLLNALANADSVTVRLYSFFTDTVDMVIPADEYGSTIKQAAKAILESHFYDNYAQPELYDEYDEWYIIKNENKMDAAAFTDTQPEEDDSLLNIEEQLLFEDEGVRCTLTRGTLVDNAIFLTLSFENTTEEEKHYGLAFSQNCIINGEEIWGANTCYAAAQSTTAYDWYIPLEGTVLENITTKEIRTIELPVELLKDFVLKDGSPAVSTIKDFGYFTITIPDD